MCYGIWFKNKIKENDFLFVLISELQNIAAISNEIYIKKQTNTFIFYFKSIIALNIFENALKQIKDYF